EISPRSGSKAGWAPAQAPGPVEVPQRSSFGIPLGSACYRILRRRQRGLVLKVGILARIGWEIPIFLSDDRNRSWEFSAPSPENFPGKLQVIRRLLEKTRKSYDLRPFENSRRANLRLPNVRIQTNMLDRKKYSDYYQTSLGNIRNFGDGFLVQRIS